MTHWIFEHQEPDHREIKPVDYKKLGDTLRSLISMQQTLAEISRLERVWMEDYILPPRKDKPASKQ